MYKRTIWQDHVEGIQEGTDMNAANFNNLEAGTMEAAALAAFNAQMKRYDDDEAMNAKVFSFTATVTGSGAGKNVDIPAIATRKAFNLANEYNVDVQLVSAAGGTVGDIMITAKQANGFTVAYNGTATSFTAVFKISGGMM